MGRGDGGPDKKRQCAKENGDSCWTVDHEMTIGVGY